MRITSLILADYVYQPQGAKPVVAGVFRTIYAPSLPAFHQGLGLFYEIEIDVRRGEGLPEVSIICRGPSKQEVFSAKGVPAGELPKTEHGDVHVLTSTLSLNGIELPEHGVYEITLTARYKRMRARHGIKFSVLPGPREPASPEPSEVD